MNIVNRMQVPVDRKVVAEVVKSCQVCKQIDPTPITWEHGQLNVEQNWQRVAADVAYVSGKPYLTMVDCGPSRFAIWTALSNEGADLVIKHLRRVFLQRGPPQELFCDYGPCFNSSRTKSFLENWGVSLIFCCAFKHSGNGIVERNHRTIKRMVARSGKTPEDMVFWYNNTPNSANVIPAAATYTYQARLPGEPESAGSPGDRHTVSTEMNPYRVGDEVFVKPGRARCDKRWKLGTVTKLISDKVVEIDNIDRHIADVRLSATGALQTTRDAVDGGIEICMDGVTAPNELIDNHNDYDDNSSSGNSDDNQLVTEEQGVAIPTRDRRPPRRLADFYVD